MNENGLFFFFDRFALLVVDMRSVETAINISSREFRLLFAAAHVEKISSFDYSDYLKTRMFKSKSVRIACA